MLVRWRFPTVAMLLAVACSGPSGLTELPSGRWGGDRVELVVGPASAQVELDCAHGSFPSPIPLREGAFEVAGVLVPERGGPVREGEVLPEYSARYRGTTDGKRMTLTIEAQGLERLGPFSLELGRSARIVKCL